jgi:hypothetical protein
VGSETGAPERVSTFGGRDVRAASKVLCGRSWLCHRRDLGYRGNQRRGCLVDRLSRGLCGRWSCPAAVARSIHTGENGGSLEGHSEERAATDPWFRSAGQPSHEHRVGPTRTVKVDREAYA